MAHVPGATETAVRVLAPRLGLGNDAVRRDLEQGMSSAFDQTTLYVRLFALADRTAGRSVPRAVLPDIELHSPKITRKLTTEWFARRVDERQRACLHRLDG